VGHIQLHETLYGRKEKCRPAEVQGWAFKIKVIPAVSSNIGIYRPENKE
jgi:hypothetical protein